MTVGLPGGGVWCWLYSCSSTGKATPALREKKELGVPRHYISPGWCVNTNVAMTVILCGCKLMSAAKDIHVCLFISPIRPVKTLTCVLDKLSNPGWDHMSYVEIFTAPFTSYGSVCV